LTATITVGSDVTDELGVFVVAHVVGVETTFLVDIIATLFGSILKIKLEVVRLRHFVDLCVGTKAGVPKEELSLQTSRCQLIDA